MIQVPNTTPKAANMSSVKAVLLLLRISVCCLEYTMPSGYVTGLSNSQVTASPKQSIKRQISSHLSQSLREEPPFSSPTFQVHPVQPNYDAIRSGYTNPSQIQRPTGYMTQISSKILCRYQYSKINFSPPALRDAFGLESKELTKPQISANLHVVR